jgi:predicted TIM-barrel fold metal-dependent hydrolase
MSDLRIDAHAHGMHAEADEHGTFLPPLVTAWRPEFGDPRDLVGQHHGRGVERVVLLDPPHVAFELAAIFGDFVIPVPQVDMDKVDPDAIDALFQRGARGIKFICPMHSYGDNRYFPLYDVIRAHRGLAVFHTGNTDDALFRPGAVLGRDDVVDITDMRPAAIDRIARKFRDLKILMAHFGNPWWEEAWTVLKTHRRVYADFSGSTAKTKPLAMWKELFMPAGQLHTRAISRLCFGTDATYFVPDQFGYAPVSSFYDRLYETLNLPQEIRLLIDRQNILSLCEAT